MTQWPRVLATPAGVLAAPAEGLGSNQHPPGGSKVPIAPVLGDPIPSVSQGLLKTCCVHITHTLFFNKNNNLSTGFKITLSITSIKAQAASSREAPS